MKILRLSTFLDFGGLETRLANISNITDENEWLFLFLCRDGKAADLIRQNGKQVINLKAKPTIYSISTFQKVYAAIKKIKPDVIHTSGAEANFHGVLAAKLLSVPVIVAEEIGVPKRSMIGKKVYGFIYMLAHHVIGNSKAVITHLRNNEKVAAQKMKVIPNPILFPSNTTQNPFPNNEAINIVSLSRLEPVKNITGVLEAIKILSQTHNLHYHIIGSGSIENELKQWVNHNNLNKLVTFWGFQENPAAFLKYANIFVLNSHSEGFSNSLAEAMYHKTVSISTKSGAAEEIILNGENGFTIPINSVESLVKKIEKIILLSKIEKEKIGQKAHQTIVDNYSLSNHAKFLYQVYKR